jgi:hypothetical protein
VANFIVRNSNGLEQIWRVHNCLLRHKDYKKANGEEEFNLLSVSQLLRTRKSNVSFGADHSSVTIQHRKESHTFPLQHVDEQFSILASPIGINDDRLRSVSC